MLTPFPLALQIAFVAINAVAFFLPSSVSIVESLLLAGACARLASFLIGLLNTGFVLLAVVAGCVAASLYFNTFKSKTLAVKEAMDRLSATFHSALALALPVIALATLNHFDFIAEEQVDELGGSCTYLWVGVVLTCYFDAKAKRPFLELSNYASNVFSSLFKVSPGPCI